MRIRQNIRCPRPLVTHMAEESTLATVATIIAAFGTAMLFFRIQRELEMQRSGETIWIPWADGLIVLSTLISLVLVVLPLIIASNVAGTLMVASTACAAAVVLVAGYPFAILAHYRIIMGGGRTGLRDNPEPAERTCVIVTIGLAVLAALVTLWSIILRGI